MPIPDRLDRIVITLAHDTLVISPESRDSLLDRINDRPEMGTVVGAFRAVGASAPVTLTVADRRPLLDAIDDWAENVGSPEKLPPGIWDLRTALSHDLPDVAS
ncbi:MAG: hypothetical protein ABUL47_06080 [Leifsonia sp.]